jgi:CYTH domain-containing protein
MKNKEIERKFAVKSYPIDRLAKLTGQRIYQYYTSLLPEIRYRRSVYFFKDKASEVKCIMCVKSEGKLVRDEFDVEIPQELFWYMKKYKIGNMIEKVRYRDEVNGHVLEIDDYSNNVSFQTVEIEFDSEYEANIFDPPDNWLEVTDDDRFKNRQLSLMSFEDIKYLNDYVDMLLEGSYE